MKIYEYKTRIIIEFNDRTRASYSKNRYGDLLNLVVEQACSLQSKVYGENAYEEARKYRLQKMKEAHYLRMCNDYLERE